MMWGNYDYISMAPSDAVAVRTAQQRRRYARSTDDAGESSAMRTYTFLKSDCLYWCTPLRLSLPG